LPLLQADVLARAPFECFKRLDGVLCAKANSSAAPQLVKKTNCTPYELSILFVCTMVVNILSLLVLLLSFIQSEGATVRIAVLFSPVKISQKHVAGS